MKNYTSEQLAWLIRRHGIEMTHLSHGSHIGAILSVADIMAVLYADVLHVDPADPKWENRDRFILSKGHAGAAVYAALAESGFFPVEELKTHYQNGSRLSGHVSHAVPGVDFSTGSLGHGLSAACGMAYALRKDKKEARVFVVLGDGECNEGSVWEAALFANHNRLNNLVAIVDRNHMASLDFTENTLEEEDFAAKWKAFGWNVIDLPNGNDHAQLKAAFQSIPLAAETGSTWQRAAQGGAGSRSETEGVDCRHVKNDARQEGVDFPSSFALNKPTVIIANTVKGFGISFMRNDILWHYRFPHDGWEYDTAVNELYAQKPEGVEDPYTPNGILHPLSPSTADDINNDHTLTHTWSPDYPEPMRRVETPSGSGEREHAL